MLPPSVGLVSPRLTSLHDINITFILETVVVRTQACSITACCFRLLLPLAAAAASSPRPVSQVQRQICIVCADLGVRRHKSHTLKRLTHTSLVDIQIQTRARQLGDQKMQAAHFARVNPNA
jgi:hypothetical protein